MRTSVLTLAVLALLAIPGVAAGAPTVRFKAEAVPIPGFKGTGNIYGAGAAIQSEFRIAGKEYGGYPPPLIGVKVYLPAGVRLHPSGFPTCPLPIIEKKEPEACPKLSSAGPPGKAEGFVVFGTERVPETVSVEGFYAAGGGLNFVVLGHTPASIEIVSSGHYSHLSGADGFGPEATFAVPLVQTVPGAPDASVERIVTKLGSALEKRGKTIYYGTMTNSCPKGHLTIKAELTFAENGDVLAPVVVSVSYNGPCPTGHRAKTHRR
jgi:hypothetical protein